MGKGQIQSPNEVSDYSTQWLCSFSRHFTLIFARSNLQHRQLRSHSSMSICFCWAFPVWTKRCLEIELNKLAVTYFYNSVLDLQQLNGDTAVFAKADVLLLTQNRECLK